MTTANQLRRAALRWALFLAPGLALAGTDVPVNGDPPGTVQNEVRITRNATDAANFVVAYNDNVGAASSPLGVSFSLDGGATWSDRQLGVPIHPLLATPDDGIFLPFIFDPYIDSDSQGNIYAGYIATDGSAGGPSGIFIERSTNKGATWSGPTRIDFNIRSLFLPPPPPDLYRFNDRPDMTVDAADDVYVVWIKDVGVGQPTSDIYFAKSPPPGAPGPGNPTGLDFTGLAPGSVAPQTVNDNPNGIDFANVPDVEVAPDGTVYVAWIDFDVTIANANAGSLLIDRSFDGGVSFGPDLLIQAIDPLPKNLTTAGGAPDARAGSYPSIAIDPANSQTVYAVWAAEPAGSDEGDIFFARSTDGGVTWPAPPLLVNDDATGNDQFHPVIAVKPDGTIDVAWYDKRNSPNDDAWDVYFARSTDGGASFGANRRISDTTFATPTDLGGSPWLGEYLDLEVDTVNAYLAFTSGVNDARGDIFFDVEANSSLLTVAIDIKPGSFPNAVNPRARGVVPVAILTTSTAAGEPVDFDATTVDASTVQFGPGAATKAHRRGHVTDADGDGDLDLVLHFRVRQTGIACGDTTAGLTGQTTGGQLFAGSDSLKTAGCK